MLKRGSPGFIWCPANFWRTIPIDPDHFLVLIISSVIWRTLQDASSHCPPLPHLAPALGQVRKDQEDPSRDLPWPSKFNMSRIQAHASWTPTFTFLLPLAPRGNWHRPSFESQKVALRVVVVVACHATIGFANVLSQCRSRMQHVSCGKGGTFLKKEKETEGVEQAT